MKTSSAYPLLAFLLAFSSFRTADAIKCFQCNSHNESACAQEVPPDQFKTECNDASHKYVLCRKIVQSIEHEVNGLQPDTRIIRSCGWDDSSYLDKCYQRSGFGGRQEVCTCTTDYCNAAGVNLLSLGLLLLSAAIAGRTLL